MNIKTTIAAALFAIGATAAQAEEIIDGCAVVGDTAQAIMDARQSGVPMSQMMKIAGTNEAARFMVTEAYGTPRFSTDSIVAEVIQDFRNDMEAICYGG